MTRVAPAAAAILTQATALRPNRSKASDGTIGDKAHRNRVSDHNPDKRGVVHAADLTHDPGHGMDAHGWAKWLADKRDPRVKYIISNRRIWEPGYGWAGYGGSNPHNKHVHVSVITRLENDTSPWFDGFLAPTPFTTTAKPAPAPVVTPPPYVPAAPVATLPTVQEDDMKVYILRYQTQPTEFWIGRGDGAAYNLNQTTGEVDRCRRIWPSVEVIGDADCNTFKTFTTELPFSAFAP